VVSAVISHLISGCTLQIDAYPRIISMINNLSVPKQFAVKAVIRGTQVRWHFFVYQFTIGIEISPMRRHLPCMNTLEFLLITGLTV
jgi:hypothetical protein